MTSSSDQIKTTCGHNHTWHEEGDRTGCLHEQFCDLLNQIAAQPDAEVKLAYIEKIINDPEELDRAYAIVCRIEGSAHV
jgi:hypothetical protein